MSHDLLLFIQSSRNSVLCKTVIEIELLKFFFFHLAGLHKTFPEIAQKKILLFYYVLLPSQALAELVAVNGQNYRIFHFDQQSYKDLLLLPSVKLVKFSHAIKSFQKHWKLFYSSIIFLVSNCFSTCLLSRRESILSILNLSTFP